MSALAVRRLSAAEAERLSRAWSSEGEMRAGDRLVLSYPPLVGHLAARKLRELSAPRELEDLVERAESGHGSPARHATLPAPAR